jgi:[ribosomal protein S5]-alanine N-acetyltransferase
MTMRRVYLKRLAAADQQDLLALVRASRRLHRGWVSPPRDPRGFRALLRRSKLPSFASLLVRRREDDALVGVFNLSQIFLGPFRSAYLGFYAGAPLAGRGYMTEGLRLVVTHAFGPALKLHRIEANIQPGNRRSIELVRRCGFALEGFSPRYLKVSGRWRDHERWARLADRSVAGTRPAPVGAGTRGAKGRRPPKS